MSQFNSWLVSTITLIVVVFTFGVLFAKSQLARNGWRGLCWNEKFVKAAFDHIKNLAVIGAIFLVTLKVDKILIEYGSLGKAIVFVALVLLLIFLVIANIAQLIGQIFAPLIRAFLVERRVKPELLNEKNPARWHDIVVDEIGKNGEVFRLTKCKFFVFLSFFTVISVLYIVIAAFLTYNALR